MPEYLSPGVYVEEFEIGARPIEGVSTSTGGFLGEAERGPTTPKLVTSWIDYQRKFGSYFGATKYLPYAVEGFFANGGQRCYIGRIVSADEANPATAASLTLQNPNTTNTALVVTAVGEGIWGRRVAVKISSGTTSGFKLSVSYWKKTPDSLYDPETDSKTLPRPKVTEVFDDLSVDEASPDYYDKRVNGISNLIKISTLTEEFGHSGTAQDGGADNITLSGDALGTGNDNVYNGMDIKIISGTGSGQTRTVTAYAGDTRIATVDSPWDTQPDNKSIYCIFMSQDINYLDDADTGSDGADLVIRDYLRTDTADTSERKGLTGFVEVDEISIVYSPYAYAVPGLVGYLITHCENLKDRFVVIDARPNQPDVSTIDPRSDNATSYAAHYYPWIKVIDPEAGVRRTIPPGGHAAGIYARSDTERGVHKAPANEVVRGAVDLEFQITKGQHDMLNPRGVNVIRAFPGRGIRVWGARTLSSNTLWKYINVRRLFIFLEESIEEGTQWVVFEPNDPKLWARVRATITGFLTTVWRGGALFGNTPEEAFFVKCDESTMTQDDIDNGRLICIIGVAPVKPAEFVIFRIAQWRGGSEVSE